MATSATLFASGSAATGQVFLVPNCSLVQVAHVLSITMYLFAVHDSSPLAYQLLRNREDWNKAVALAIAISLLLIVTAGVVGYAAFGTAAQQSYMNNIGRDLQLQMLPGSFGTVCFVICNMMTVLKRIVSQPFIVGNITLLVEEHLPWLAVGPAQVLLWRGSLFAFGAAFCILLDVHVAYAQEIAGAFAGTLCCCILPGLAIVQLLWHKLGPVSKIVIVPFILVSCAYAVYGTKLALDDLLSA
eukprot:gnl/TRDRNA2_/TRDRNA2_172384_c6_seq3.p1 gnl/TRDRNA2_/TRDRNA2_172384_c6~~gnl/TRDRNA2_/TRDRNA2_172384_c6_seq3.p1  ORF type:complete len:262 (-),score=29.18 gnl/TRDRNA2_/TRDRNA2_172384_c6_seq3:94-822(-)